MNGQPCAFASLGYVRVAAVTPEVRVADVAYNTQAILASLEEAAAQGCTLALFPELAVTGYTCADLFYQSLLRDQARAALRPLAQATGRLGIGAVIGLPLEVGGKLYNCAAFLAEGAVVGVVPKTYLPATQEYYEERWFSSSRDCPVDVVDLDGQTIPFGADLLFTARNMPHCVLGIEICEDLWATNPPSGSMALAGATLFLNPSASDEVLGKAEYRRALVTQQSARCLAGYVYAGSGPGESTTDVVFGGHCLIAEDGILLAETPRFHFERQMALADLDLEQLAHERITNSSFSSALPTRAYRQIAFTLPTSSLTVATDVTAVAPPLLRPPLSQTPFVPTDPTQRATHCEEIFAIQSTGLARRLQHTGSHSITLGLSGGLDSTLALLVTLRAFATLDLPPSGIVAVSMPGFGTSTRTRRHARRLAELVGVTLREISIEAAVRQHFQDIGHDERVTDVTYENAQARERTQILMDLANQVGGLVVGTGDLSELALGWATYNGDQMSMYHVNAGVPKTLVRYLIAWSAESLYHGATAQVLRAICATPSSPELLPQSAGKAVQNAVAQETEAAIGPFLLHDFFLFCTVRYGFSPRKTLFLATRAFAGRYTPQEIVRWLQVFLQRFFANQFKRSAMPDGPKVGSVALSPRGDWRMPSDASVALWRQELDQLQALLGESAEADGPA
jgi:NAD+ synthase (glutamine-hydrolysing)